MFSIVKHITAPKPTYRKPQETFWQVQSIDTMKFSRDASKDPSIAQQIPLIVSEVASLHANYIAVDTPYDEEFYPVLKTWVDEARKQHLKVWFRGNFSSWEGWFGYAKFQNSADHHALTYAFITKHPELFQSNDIFTPIPEPENGGLGDPRKGETSPEAFNAFLIASYQNCTNAFKTIHTDVTCGYFSVNGDIAKQVLTKETVQKIGNVVVIDHYVSSPEKMEEELTYLEHNLGGKIVLGEFGAPIPDINGDMNESQQSDFIKSIMQVLYKHKDTVTGLNYWVGQGSSTALYTDAGIPKLAASVIDTYYHPMLISGQITNVFGKSVSDANIYSEQGELLGKTDINGIYTATIISIEQVATKIVVTAPGYTEKTVSFSPRGDKTNIENIQIESSNTTFLNQIQGATLQLLGF